MECAMRRNLSRRETALREVVQPAAKAVAEYAQSNGFTAEETRGTVLQLVQNRTLLRAAMSRPSNSQMVDVVVLRAPRR